MKKISILLGMSLIFAQYTFASQENDDSKRIAMIYSTMSNREIRIEHELKRELDNRQSREVAFTIGAGIAIVFSMVIGISIGHKIGMSEGYETALSNARIAFNSGYQKGLENCNANHMWADFSTLIHFMDGQRLGAQDCEATKKEELQKKLNIKIDKEKIAAFVGDKQMCSNKKKLKTDMSKWLD